MFYSEEFTLYVSDLPEELNEVCKNINLLSLLGYTYNCYLFTDFVIFINFTKLKMMNAYIDLYTCAYVCFSMVYYKFSTIMEKSRDIFIVQMLIGRILLTMHITKLKML